MSDHDQAGLLDFAVPLAISDVKKHRNKIASMLRSMADVVDSGDYDPTITTLLLCNGVTRAGLESFESASELVESIFPSNTASQNVTPSSV